jgi:hypothetical protein
MRVITGGQERTKAEYGELLNAAGQNSAPSSRSGSHAA